MSAVLDHHGGHAHDDHDHGGWRLDDDHHNLDDNDHGASGFDDHDVVAFASGGHYPLSDQLDAFGIGNG
jgi:hypothetical protein